MNPKFYLIACLSFSFNHMVTHQTIAMGNKDVPVESITLKTKQQLIEELFTLFQFDKMTLEALLQPFEKELKSLGLPEKPFEQSIKKLNEITTEISAPLIDLLKELYIRAHENSFTQQELTDLITLYKKPVIQKANLLALTIFTDPIITALKDPQIFQEYTSKIMAIGITMAAQNSSSKTMEIATIAVKEFQEFMQNKEIYTPEFLEKLKQRYKGLAPTLEKWFGKEISEKKITELKEFIEKMPFLKQPFASHQISTEPPIGTSSTEAIVQTPTLPN
jgi:hypothetical protein